jgi:PIN domain nuclease of toxin-antitoxin system
MKSEMPSTLDASAMLALIRSEPGAAVVLAALATPGNTCHAHEVNLCEVFYVRARHTDEETAAEEMRYLLGTAGIRLFTTPGLEFTWEVGRLRARITGERLAASLADCFCVATARALGGDLLTADQTEFEPLAALGLCQVTFIR